MKTKFILGVFILAGFLFAGSSSTNKDPFYPSNENKLDTMNNIPKMNGFSLDQLQIPLDEIYQGGPPKDGIPSIDQPKFVNAKNATFLDDSDEVLGIVMNGITKVYPIRILNYHEVVNDLFNDEPVVITFCPLCGSGVAFSGLINGKKNDFGVSGLLFNSDVLLYDRNTESLWSQLIGKSISGPLVNTKLALIAMEQTTWGNWRKKHENTLVLSTETGHIRDYSRLPYAGYEDKDQLYFPVKSNSDLFHKKDRVIGISIEGIHKAYAFKRLKNAPELPFEDEINGIRFLIDYDIQNESARITNLQGKVLPATTLFWFAWFTFLPDTQVY